MSTTSSHLLLRVLDRVLDTVGATWPFLVLSVLLASAVQVYVGTDRLGGWLRRSTPVAVLGAVALGALTPFCSCGTMAESTADGFWNCCFVLDHSFGTSASPNTILSQHLYRA